MPLHWSLSALVSHKTQESYLNAWEAQFLNKLSLEICYYTLERAALDSLLNGCVEVLPVLLAPMSVIGRTISKHTLGPRSPYSTYTIC